MKDNTIKYKLETWKHRTKREYPNSKKGTTKTGETFFYSESQRLVKRGANGKFLKGSPVIKDIRTKTYGTGFYRVGVVDGKIITRQLIAKRNVEWYNKRNEVIKNRQIFRCSVTLNDIPYMGEVYYGFKIVAFSHNKNILSKIYTEKMKKRLIQFVEKCLKYHEDDFWFDYYWGYEKIDVCNASISDNNKFYLLWQKRYGSIVRQEIHSIGEL